MVLCPFIPASRVWQVITTKHGLQRFLIRFVTNMSGMMTIVTGRSRFNTAFLQMRRPQIDYNLFHCKGFPFIFGTLKQGCFLSLNSWLWVSDSVTLGMDFQKLDSTFQDIWHGLRCTFLWACSRKVLRITYKILERICNGSIRLSYKSTCSHPFRTLPNDVVITSFRNSYLSYWFLLPLSIGWGSHVERIILVTVPI